MKVIAMSEVKQTDRGWDVVDTDGRVLASFPTNAEAWRFADRCEGDPVSRSENVASWIMSRAGTDDRQGTLPKLKRPSVRDRLRRKRWKR
jgi:hypothetical protein